MTMKISAQRSVLSILLALLLCCLSADAALTKKVHSSRKSLRVGRRGSGDGAGKTDTKQDATSDEDDDDDDDDDDEDTAAGAPAAAPKPTKHLVNVHAKEEGKLQAAVLKVQQEIAANLGKQAELKQEVKHFSDESQSNAEIDQSVKLVANETDSVAMAGMLGKMWKEMRMFELPLFEEHVDDELRVLKHDEKKLQGKLTASQAKLVAARRKWAKEAGKKVPAQAAAEEDTATVADKKADDEAEEPKKKEAPQVATVNGLSGTDDSVNSRVLHKYSVWHMSPAQRKAVFASTMVYLVFGILVAFLYKQARTRYPKAFEPQSRPAQASSQKDFSSTLFGCFGDPNICVVGCLCPCLRWADTMDQKNLMSYWKAFFVMFILMLLHVYTAGISTLAVCIIGVYHRQKLRKIYGLAPSTGATLAMDSFAWLCCQPCAIIQEAREGAIQSA